MLNASEYKKLSASEIIAGVSDGRFSTREIVDAALALAESDGKTLNCFITLCHEKARGQAERLDKKRARGEKLGALAGVPIAVKDNISYRDYPTTCGSRILDGYVPPYDATVVERLLAQDAIIIGKTNLDEFAMGSSNENSHFGPVKNPIDHALAPGGSSGGSAVSVAAQITPLALGSETGGSVRQPAAFCGIYGLKPSYGAVSRYGLVAFGSSLDQIGQFARTTEDLVRLYSAVAGHDDKDSTSTPFDHPSYHSRLDLDRKLTIGLPKECYGAGLDSGVAERMSAMRRTLESRGHKFINVTLPTADAGVACYYIVATAEASSNLARFDGVKYGLCDDSGGDLKSMYERTRGRGFGAEVKRRIILGTYVLSSGYYDAYYLRGMKVRELIRRDFRRVFAEVDLLLTPTTPTPAFRLGEKVEDPLAMYLSDIYTVPANLAGICAISVPAGRVADGRPVGAQFVAPAFGEELLFKIARECERADA